LRISVASGRRLRHPPRTRRSISSVSSPRTPLGDRLSRGATRGHPPPPNGRPPLRPLSAWPRWRFAEGRNPGRPDTLTFALGAGRARDHRRGAGRPVSLPPRTPDAAPTRLGVGGARLETRRASALGAATIDTVHGLRREATPPRAAARRCYSTSSPASRAALVFIRVSTWGIRDGWWPAGDIPRPAVAHGPPLSCPGS